MSTQPHSGISKSTALFVALLLLAAGVLLYHLGEAPLIPFDDATYADISKNIVTTGDWLHFRWLGGLPFLEKPPLYFWITATLFKLFGISEYAARLFPAFCGIGLLACVYALALVVARDQSKLVDRKSLAILAPLTLLIISDFWQFSSRAMLDIPVTLFITLALGCFWVAQRKSEIGWYLIYGVAVAIAILIKSVVGLIPVFVTIFFFLATNPKRLLDRKYIAGTFLALALSIPWHIFMYLSRGELFLREYFAYHIIQRFVGNIAVHQLPPWYFLSYLWHQETMLLVSLIAIAPLLIYLIIRRRDEVCTFLAIWSLFVFILISLSKAKLPWYIVPFYPPVTVLISYVVEQFSQRSRLLRTAIAIVLLSSSVLVGYRFHKLQIQHTSQTYVFTQLTTIAKELKVVMHPQEDIYVFDDSEPMPLINFYADCPAHLLFSKAQTMEVFMRMPTNYFQEGIARFIPNINDLVGFIGARTGLLLVNRDIYGALAGRVRLRTVAETKDFVVVRFTEQ